jgi:2-dehydro-3-deoxy-D-arabinonate dehydratase
MKLYRTTAGVVAESDGRFVALPDDWDALINYDDLHKYLSRAVSSGRALGALTAPILAPIGQQEVWAAGVTYYRSRAARIEESRDAGGGTFYDRVYDAQRPELFFKSAAWRVRGPGEPVRIRRDARWSVPEPEIAVCVNARGAIVGYTIGNDMSSRDIEGENPLYLSQAKIYDGACALGPALLVTNGLLSPETSIGIRVDRLGEEVFSGETTYSQLRRSPSDLVEFLYRETSFPNGCVLLTGTGIVPDADFTLLPGDEISINVPPIGVLTNAVAGK